jgi:MFS transporter, CP family, cyanate transporter
VSGGTNTDEGGHRRARRTGLLVAMSLGALALRPQLVGIGPLLPRIQDGLGVSHGIAGLLGTIPVLCMGLFAPFGALLAGRVGTNRAIAAALVLIAAFGSLRALAPGILLLLLLTVPVGIGMALGNALMPLAVTGSFADRPLGATGAYTTGIQTGSALAALVAVPAAAAFGGWRAALALFGAGAMVSAAAWTVITPRRAGAVPRGGALGRLPWRSGLAWRLVGAFCAISTYYYGIGAWLPEAFTERGWSEGAAGTLIAVFNLASIPGGVAVALVGERMGSRRGYMLAASALLAAGAMLLVLAPGGGYAWALLAGFGNGMVFPLIMTLPLDVARTPADVGAVAGMMLGVGYSVGALSPFVLGVFRDATGSFTTSLWAIVGLAFLLAVNVSFLHPARLRRGVPLAVTPAP